MAKAPAAKNLPVAWEEEMAKEAAIAAKMEENVGGGNFFSTKGGVLTYNDAPFPNNEMAVVILDSVLENVFYEGDYNPDSPASPLCYAFGRDEATLAPHSKVIELHTEQAPSCAECPMNVFGSADKGRGKACKNGRRLGLISAGTFDKNGRFEMIEDPEHFEKAAAAFYKLSVTSVKGYAAYVKQLAAVLKRPPYGVFTKIKVVPDPKNQFVTTFEALGAIPNELLPAIKARHDEIAATIDFPYSTIDPDAAPAAKPAKKAKAGPGNRPQVRRGGVGSKY